MATLTTDMLNRMAATVFAAIPGQLLVTRYLHRVHTTDTPVAYGPFDAKWEDYSDHIVSLQSLVTRDQAQVIRGDRQVRIPTSTITWTPTLFDEVLHPDGSHWRVKSILGGPLRPFYLLQVRAVPGA